MRFIRKYIGDLFIPMRFYLLTGLCGLLFVLAFFVPVIYPFVRIIGWVYFMLICIDYIFMFFLGRSPRVKRMVGDRLSNGDQNRIILRISNRMNFAVHMTIIDELPAQFQVRDFELHKSFAARQELQLGYSVKPTERGVYEFGRVLLYTTSGLGLLSRRFVIDAAQSVSVYPSFMQLRKYQLISHTTLANEHGSKKYRKIGHSMEFEQIKDYVTGDDMRSINWKATARKGMLMVNNYTDEKSQQVFCLVDKGRLMKMPFNGLSLLDYAINSSLVMTNVCLQKQDKIGLITFADKIGSVLPAERKATQRENILQVLYKQQTAFLESDFEMLYLQLRQKIKQRSLLVLYTNFESLNGLHRQLPYLRSIARHHLLLVVFFENTELSRLSHAEAHNLEDVYVKTIADKFVSEKKMIVKELSKYGILSILTSPENLTVNSINKYLELKARQAI
ncbi:MAG TPA: DUF58 domain-containing protein [Ferruginibacter sp.]|nr:DUF58 domain-containing protein [Ferruginibacter sp.]